MVEREIVDQIIDSVAQAPGNGYCADCKVPINVLDGSACLSTRFGVVLCESCGEMHRRALRHTRIVPLRDLHSNLSKAELDFFAGRSNALVNESLEKCIKLSYRRPTARAPDILKEEFVRAKYERAEFMEESPESFKEIRTTMLKRGKNKDTWKMRWFLLSQRDGTLVYFTKEEQRVPKARIGLIEINVTFAGEKCGRLTALQVTYLHRGSTRSLFVAAIDDNPKAAVDWYNAVRHAKLQYLRIAYPTCDDCSLIFGSSSHTRFGSPAVLLDESTESEVNLHSQTAPVNGSTASFDANNTSISVVTNESVLSDSCTSERRDENGVTASKKLWGSQPTAFCDNLTHDFEIEGWLIKAPPRRRDAWCRRWFVLDGRKLSYYFSPLDAFAKGEIFIGPRADNFDLVDGIPDDVVDLFELRRVEQANVDARGTLSVESPAVTHSPSSSSLGQARPSVLANQSDLSGSSSSFGEASKLNDSSKRLSQGAKSTSRSLDALTTEQVKERSFTLITPARTFLMVAESLAAKTRWLAALSIAVYSATQPKDNVTAATLVRKRRANVQSIVSMLKEKL